MLMLLTVVLYFSLLFAVSRLSSKGTSNEDFYRGHRRSPWYMVAFGMVGASISGVTLVSVPGMVMRSDMTYLQTCLGFIPGYFVVAWVLLPLYYRMNLTSIYALPGERIGPTAHRTASMFFLVSKIVGAAVRFYVVCMLLQRFVFSEVHLPFALTVPLMVALIWLYTRRGGIRTLVWTDTFQTLCLFTAVVLIFVQVAGRLGMGVGEAVHTVAQSSYSRIFVLDDWMNRQHFVKQFLSGIFIVIVMTGLDQDMMQKNLTCKNLKEARKDMCTYGFAFVPANLLFLSLGVLLVMLAQQQGVALPDKGDELLPMFAGSGALGSTVMVLFTIGIVAASFSSADSALTALTTCFCVDICHRPGDEQLRKRAHLGICLLFVVFIWIFEAVNSTSVIDAIYILCSYTYGPLLGLFACSLCRRTPANDRLVPYVCVASPIVCGVVEYAVQRFTGYRFGYELLMLNGLITFAGLLLCLQRRHG